MRTNISVLWLDDDKDSEVVSYMKTTLQDLFLRKGYKCSINSLQTRDESLAILRGVERTDMVFSDYNIDSSSDGPLDNTGVAFLLKVRKEQIYKQQFVLYSQNNENEIKNAIKTAIDYEKLSDFNNFSFFSLNERRNEAYDDKLEKYIDIYLSRWQELNALRGRMMSEHSDLHEELKILFSLPETSDYWHAITELKRNMNDRTKKAIFDRWWICKELRNAYAHVNEGKDNLGYFITLKDRTRIYEHEVANKRKELLNDIDSFKSLINEYKRKNNIN